MAFWQENYQFIKEVYDMRHMKMAEWMENVEKSISRIMADKVYTSAEFKRERDTFNVSFININIYNSPWRIRHTNPKIENQIFLEFHFLPPKYC